jgi:threonine dehydratase
MIEYRDIQAAAVTIQHHVHKTPLIHSNSFSRMASAVPFAVAVKVRNKEHLDEILSDLARKGFEVKRTP